MLAMGRARAVLFIGVVGSWMFQVPLAFVFTKYFSFQDPLYRLFTGVLSGYFVICVLMTFMIIFADWKK